MEKLIECLQKLGFKNAAKSLTPGFDFIVLGEPERAVVTVLEDHFNGEVVLSAVQEMSESYHEAEILALKYVDALAKLTEAQGELDKLYSLLERANEIAETEKEVWGTNEDNARDEIIRTLFLADRLRATNREAVYDFERQLRKLAVNVEPYNPGFCLAGDPDR